MALRTPSIALLTLLTVPACSPPPQEGGADAHTKRDDASPKRDEGSGSKPSTGDTGGGAQVMGRIRPDAPIALGSLLGRGPEEVEKILGEPAETGSSRISCVRFLPERVFFACEQEARQYTDKSGKFEGIKVEYEDKKAAAIALTGLVGEGEFTPEKALEIVGLELPGEHRSIQPREGVTVWDYWNTEARLVVDGKQYRVQVSDIDGEWPRSKVEIMINHPLTDDETSRIKPAGG